MMYIIYMHIYAYGHMDKYDHMISYMGVDQNKGIWGSLNRRSTANQPRSQRCQFIADTYITCYGNTYPNIVNSYGHNNQDMATYHSYHVSQGLFR